MKVLKNEVLRTRVLKGQEGAIYCGRDFSPAQQNESELYGLDFVNDLVAGEALTSAAWTLTVTNGVDGTPSSHLIGSPTLVTPDGTTVQTETDQRIQGLLPDVTYAVQAVAVTNKGNTKTLYSHVRGVDVA